MVEILRFPELRLRRGQAAQTALIHSIAQARHPQQSVLWLKENAELLNILEATGAGSTLAAEALLPLRDFYQEARRALFFFRPYYRFFLSICLDLEDLAASSNFALARKGGIAADLAHWVQVEGLPQQELSDLQRAEAQRLLARRGVKCDFPGLEQRLRSFMEASTQFCLPNKKAGYELTHIVFYLSQYGRHAPNLSANAHQSLIYVGLLALLDQDADLLAEVCVALRYAGAAVPRQWEHWLQCHLEQFEVQKNGFSGQDDYHVYFVQEWLRATRHGGAFSAPLASGGGVSFHQPVVPGVLQALSQLIFCSSTGGVGRGADWDRQRVSILAGLSEAQAGLLLLAEGSTNHFGEFFEHFARSGMISETLGGAA